MSDKIITIAKIVFTVFTYLATAACPALFVFYKKINAVKGAKTNEDRQKIINELKTDAEKFIIDAENMYRTVDYLVKHRAVLPEALKKKL